MDINFYMPAKVIMGKDCIRKNSDIFSRLGKKALVVTGARSAKVNGSLDDVTQALEKAGCAFEVFDKVMSNPTIDCAYEGAKAAKETCADFIVAIGGGSPMDAAKAMAILACQNIKREELFSGNYGEEVLPIVAVPTTAGTGSEVTKYSILTNDAVRTKTSIATAAIIPTVSFLDGKYLKGINRNTAINTGIDALSHAVEGMLSKSANPFCDLLAKESIKRITACFDALYRGELTDEDRESLLYASMLAGIVINHTGTTAVHSMGYSLTYFKNIDHGRANGLLLCQFLNFVEDKDPGKTAEIIKSTGFKNIDGFSKAIDRLLGEKEKLTPKEIEEFSEIAIKAKNIANCFTVPKKEDLLNIYKAVFLQNES